MRMKSAVFEAALLLAGLAPSNAWAFEENALDLPARLAGVLAHESAGKLTLGAEFRSRFERRTGQGFGKEPDLDFGLIRARLSMTYQPWRWMKLSAMVQDARAPGYGPAAPSNFRDSADLQEAYFELGDSRGLGGSAGRAM